MWNRILYPEVGSTSYNYFAVFFLCQWYSSNLFYLPVPRNFLLHCARFYERHFVSAINYLLRISLKAKFVSSCCDTFMSVFLVLQRLAAFGMWSDAGLWLPAAVVHGLYGPSAYRDVEAVIFQPLPPTKTEKTTVDNFFNFCGSLACLLLHFVILRRPKSSFIAITLPTSLELIVSNYSVFVFLRY